MQLRVWATNLGLASGEPMVCHGAKFPTLAALPPGDYRRCNHDLCNYDPYSDSLTGLRSQHNMTVLWRIPTPSSARLSPTTALSRSLAGAGWVWFIRPRTRGSIATSP